MSADNPLEDHTTPHLLAIALNNPGLRQLLVNLDGSDHSRMQMVLWLVTVGNSERLDWLLRHCPQAVSVAVRYIYNSLCRVAL
jgi:hypothetical protein